MSRFCIRTLNGFESVSDLQRRHSPLHRIVRRFRQKVVNLNLFDSESNNIDTRREERASTWLYVTLSVVILSVFTISTVYETDAAIGPRSISSFSDYQILTRSSLEDLRCACTQIAVSYRHFITLNASFHQVCSSDFVDGLWIDFLFDDGIWLIYQRSDLRVRGAAYFALLASLCDFFRFVIHDSVDQLLDETFVNNYLISEDEFQSKTTMLLGNFIKRLALGYASELELIQSLTYGNTFVSTYFLNWDWESPTNQSLQQVATRPARLDRGCSCATRTNCSTAGGTYFFVDHVMNFSLPGFVVLCSSVDTVLESTLECFYDRTCLDALINALRSGAFGLRRDVHVDPLNATVHSRFSIRARLRNLIELLMVEEWRSSVSYPAFYEQCAPRSCTHVYQQHDDPWAILTRILGLHGGLTVALRLIVPRTIQLAMKIRHRRRTTVVVAIN